MAFRALASVTCKELPPVCGGSIAVRSCSSRAATALLIQCDFQYVINSLTKWRHGWKKRGWRKADGKPVLNADLVKDLDAALAGRTLTMWERKSLGKSVI